jgi:hypothetical protein
MHLIVRLLIGLGLLAAFAGRAAAQEIQVPLDEAGRVEVIDTRLAQRIGLFVDRYPGFEEARLFRAADSTFVLEITTSRRGQVSRERIPLSAAEVADLRRDVSARLTERAPSAALNQEGRYLLLTQTSLLGLGFYGWAVPYMLDAEDTGAFAMYLLTAGSSFFAPYALTENQPVSYGMANLSRYGATRGIAHGLLLHRLIAGEEKPKVICHEFGCFETSEDDPSQRAITTALVGSVAEGVAGYLWARNEQMTAGTANAISLGGDAGLLWGLGSSILVGTDDIDERTTAAITLPFAAAGVVAGHRLAAQRDYTWGDVDVMYTAGLLGAYGGIAMMNLAGADEGEPFAMAMMVGSAAGLYVSDRLVRDTDFSVGQASLNRLGTLAGGLLGASLGVLAEDVNIALVGSALGALGGFAATYGTLAPAAREQRGEIVSAWNVRVMPQSLLLGRRSGDRGDGGPALPLVSVQYRF